MAYELRRILISDLQIGEKNEITNGVLTVDKAGIIELVKKDKRIKNVELELAKPGESVRIVPVKDVIEPRIKVDGVIFPGVCGEIEEAGKGITYALSNCAIVTTGPIVGFQEGIIDMSGPAAKYSPFSNINNIVVVIKKNENVNQHEHEEAVREAGIKVAKYVAEAALTYDLYESEFIEEKTIRQLIDNELPKVVYVYNCMAQGLLHDSYLYGRDMKKAVPTLLTAEEVYDGALISGNCVSPGSKTTTYHHQNNAVIKECLKRDGKEINFMGIVLNPLMVTLEEKYRNTVLTLKYTKFLDADAAIISQEGFGNPTTDLMLICKGLEQAGISTVIITNEDAGEDGMSESLPDVTREANAIVSTGNSNETILLPKMDKVIGELKEIVRVTGGNSESIKEDGSLLVEIHGIMGSHNLQGNTYLSALTI